MELRQPRAALTGQRLGRCYELALYTVYDNMPVDGITLVHGLVHHPQTGKALHHAWVEFKDESVSMVFDTTLNRYLVREVYYAWFRAIPERKYSHLECVANGLRSYHCGPWHEVDWSLDAEDPREEKREHETRHLS